MDSSDALSKNISFVEVFVNIKSVGKRKDSLHKAPLSLPSGITSAQELIEQIVRLGVRNFNKRSTDSELVQWLTQQHIDTMGAYGKVSFSVNYNENIPDEQQAVDHALQSFADGLYQIFINDNPVLVDHPCTLKDGDILTFIRLTMLSGRLW